MVAIFDFPFRLTAAPLTKMVTSIPNEYLKCYISITINSRDSKFGSLIEDNECSNFDLYHVEPFESRDLLLDVSEFSVLDVKFIIQAIRERAFCEFDLLPTQNTCTSSEGHHLGRIWRSKP